MDRGIGRGTEGGYRGGQGRAKENIGSRGEGGGGYKRGGER